MTCDGGASSSLHPCSLIGCAAYSFWRRRETVAQKFYRQKTLSVLKEKRAILLLASSPGSLNEHLLPNTVANDSCWRCCSVVPSCWLLQKLWQTADPLGDGMEPDQPCPGALSSNCHSVLYGCYSTQRKLPYTTRHYSPSGLLWMLAAIMVS